MPSRKWVWDLLFRQVILWLFLVQQVACFGNYSFSHTLLIFYLQLFSESTAAALEFYSRQDVCKELHDSKATAAFTRRMNGLFDCLNSRRPEHVQYNEAEHIAVRNTTRDFICYYGYPAFIYCYRCNMNIFQTLKENQTWLNNCCDYIESLPKQRQACFLTKPTSEALRVTLLSTIALVENLLASGFRYVLVGNFGQDPLEVNM